MHTYLEFESQIAELEGKIAELRALADEDGAMSIEQEMQQLERKSRKNLADLYRDLDAWQKTQVARHPDRPHFMDYARTLFSEFVPLAGDRKFGDDQAIIGGPARFNGEPMLILGHEKGSDTQSRISHNFGMARPEGYRKAVRLMELAERFGLPVVTFIDTAGAYPGIGAEERGQAEAIARNLISMAQIRTPIIVCCIGEGGSGGALALGVGNRVLMLENAVYSVISPESCAAIVWRDASKAELAARALKLTAQDLLQMSLLDEIVPEPAGGAHADYDAAAEMLSKALEQNLRRLEGFSADELVEDRYRKFRSMGNFFEEVVEASQAADHAG